MIENDVISAIDAIADILKPSGKSAQQLAEEWVAAKDVLSTTSRELQEAQSRNSNASSILFCLASELLLIAGKGGTRAYRISGDQVVLVEYGNIRLITVQPKATA